MLFTFQTTVEVDHTSGKFVSRDEISDEISEAIESADPGSIDVSESEYETTVWEVTDISGKPA